VIDRNDIIKKLRQTEQVLTGVEEDMARLEADTKNIRQKLLNCQQQVNAELEKSLNRSDSLKSKSKCHEAINSHEKDVDNH
jgi:recombinational DNA repair ATPase RecF